MPSVSHAVMSSFDHLDLSGVRALLLDLDSTLYCEKTCHEYALRRCYVVYARRVAAVPFETFAQMYTDAQQVVKRDKPTQAASHSRFLYFQALFERACGHTDVALTLFFERLYWYHYLSRMELYPGVRAFLARARARGVRVGIVTNLTARIQFAKIRHLHLDHLVDFVVSSEEVGVEKPHPSIFTRALEKLGVRPHETLMIGDNHEHDIRGAERLGIRAVRVDHV